MTLSLFTAPTLEPLDLDEVKLHLRVDHDDEDALIESLIVAARMRAETETGRALLSQTWDLTLPDFPCGVIELPKPPLRSVTSVTYVDLAGVSQTWGASNYQVSVPAGLYASRGRLAPAYQVQWPQVRYGLFAGVTVRFVAGYGTTPADVPQVIKQAMLLTIGEWFDLNRQSVSERTSVVASFPNAAVALLGSFCDRPFGV